MPTGATVKLDERCDGVGDVRARARRTRRAGGAANPQVFLDAPGCVSYVVPSTTVPVVSPVTVSFSTLVSEAFERCENNLELAAIPFVSALLQVHEIRAVLVDPADFRLGISFAVPMPIVDVWAFTSGGGSGVSVTTPEPPFLFVFPVVVLVEAALMAVYVGSLDDVIRTGSYDVGANLRTYFVQFLTFNVLLAAAFIGVVGIGLGTVLAGGVGAGFLLLVFVLVGGVVLSYLFYAAPFLFVVEGLGVLNAFRRSYDLALDGGDYASFWLKHLGVGVLVSVPITILVYNVPLLGILLGAAIAAPVGMGFTGATLLFLHRHLGDEPGPDSDRTVPPDRPASVFSGDGRMDASSETF